ncbi:hypothetical protein R1sor_000316 [Riccia sorocarpa]|uniref:Transmembrane protein n=1 Tax=Riccia sorocarpa TaxID=122646 RepID=A0ABD3GYS3_9MARC
MSVSRFECFPCIVAVGCILGVGFLITWALISVILQTLIAAVAGPVEGGRCLRSCIRLFTSAMSQLGSPVDFLGVSSHAVAEFGHQQVPAGHQQVPVGVQTSLEGAIPYHSSLRMPVPSFSRPMAVNLPAQQAAPFYAVESVAAPLPAVDVQASSSSQTADTAQRGAPNEDLPGKKHTQEPLYVSESFDEIPAEEETGVGTGGEGLSSVTEAEDAPTEIPAPREPHAEAVSKENSGVRKKKKAKQADGGNDSLVASSECLCSIEEQKLTFLRECEVTRVELAKDQTASISEQTSGLCGALGQMTSSLDRIATSLHRR